MATPSTLTADLRRLVLRVEADLTARIPVQDVVEQRWREEYDTARSVGRTATTWEQWSGSRVTQAAVAHVLATVFVRFCEDNGLIRQVWIAGPDGRTKQAVDAQYGYLREQTRAGLDVTDREWLTEPVRHLANLPATADMFRIEVNPLWQIAMSGDMATEVLAFWREEDETGRLRRSFVDPALDTRFLGDLYQDLSESAREQFALLQTPEFVEEFILDLTLTPALAERPLDGFRLIDPTCGSGHFLLGAFDRLHEAWRRHAPALEPQARVQKVLDAVHGVDINPFAVAIAQFRLLVAALRVTGERSLEDAPGYRLNLAAGDSLVHGRIEGQRAIALDLGSEYDEDVTIRTFGYATENVARLREILTEGQYDVVVGNPPYITVKDKALNALYRDLYGYCKGTYALTVPFAERFFALGKTGERAGWVGQITSNSFMKREFGGPLIEKFFPMKDLTHVIDTSGAYIPGHGTPTVILVGRNRAAVTSTVRAVLGIRGEPGKPQNPAKALVWTSIREHVTEPGHENEWVTVADLERKSLAGHPWSLSGGGAVQLGQRIRVGTTPLASRIRLIGFGAVTREDSAYMVGRGPLRRAGIPDELTRPLVEGDVTRDWAISEATQSLWPYEAESLETRAHPELVRILWPYKRILSDRVAYGSTQIERGLTWFEYSMFFAARYRTPLSIAFAFVATHNHFVLDRGGRVFNRSAPVIKLPEGATEDEHLALLGVLNSSTACFWLKQNSHDKGSQGINEGAKAESWERFFEFTGTTLQDYPLPPATPTDRARSLDAFAQALSAARPTELAQRETPTRASLDAACAEYDQVHARMISEQEELDWDVYARYGLTDTPLTYDGDDLPSLALGERAFEIVLARQVAAGGETTAWFGRHGSTPITEIPTHSPDAYRELVQRRIDLIAADRNIRLLERPEYKRRWASESWEKQEERALRGWLLDRLEAESFWFNSQGRPTVRSVASLADALGTDREFVEVVGVWEGRPDIPLRDSLSRLLDAEYVPYLAALRYKDSGLAKRRQWEDVWARHRLEDAGTYDASAAGVSKGQGPIPVPPKYVTGDFRKVSYWSHRGKLDVPKERFIGYPGAERSTDPSTVLGWAGWDHAQQAFALANLIGELRRGGAGNDRLVPLVAGLDELHPWLVQWHGEVDPRYGANSPADTIGQFIASQCAGLGVARESLAAWRAPATARGRRRASSV